MPAVPIETPKAFSIRSTIFGERAAWLCPRRVPCLDNIPRIG